MADLGPFSHHVYLAFCTYDLPRVNELRVLLESQNILCLARHDSSQASAGTMTSIKTGIARSRKVVVYFSTEYYAEEWCDTEINLIKEKASRFSRDSIIVLKNEDVSQTTFSSKLSEVDIVTIKEAQLSDQAFVTQLKDWILKEPNCQLVTMPKENIGHGAAVGYYYGFLRLVLPEFRQRLLKETLCNDEETIPNTVEKMLIIMPESCWCPPSFVEKDIIKFTGKYVVRIANRAGNTNRDYKSSLYSIVDKQPDGSDAKTYYFVGELATPLLTMYESYYFEMTGMTKDQLYAERDAFYWTLKAILNHEKNKDCNDQFELLVWKSDPACDIREDKKIPFAAFMLPEVKRLIEAKKSRGSKDTEKDDPQLCADDGVASGATTRTTQETFTIVESRGSNPGGIYERALIGEYQLNQEKKGVCLIICNKTFGKSTEHNLAPREGAEVDIGSLQKVFEDLNFEVQLHQDLTLETLERLLLTTSRHTDHSNYGAFACVFMTHGKLGQLYTSDSKPIRILDMVDYFSDKHCESLRGKPKMFFIQACQKGDPESEAGQLATDGVVPTDTDPNTYDRMLEEDAATEKTLLSVSESGPTDNKLRSLLVPSSPDFIMSYATLPGSTAYRDTQLGSLYISELKKQLGNRMELDRALKMVTQGVKKALEDVEYSRESKKFQVPFHLTTTDKLINL